jgi:GTP pyrophosphokinase
LAREAHGAHVSGNRSLERLDDVLAVASHLAETGHAGPVSLVAALLYSPIITGVLSADAMRTRLDADLGAQVLALIEAMRGSVTPGQLAHEWSSNASSHAGSSGVDAHGIADEGTPKHERKRQRQRNAELLSDLLLVARQDPRLAAWKLADRLYLIGTVRAAAEAHGRREVSATEQPAARPGTEANVRGVPGMPSAPTPRWTLDGCITIAHETRDAYIPVAAHLGMRRLEGKLQDHTFAVLQPEDYRRLSDALAAETQGWQSYLERVRTNLLHAMRTRSMHAEVAYRVKALYSVYQKLKRLESTDPASLFDLLAVRLITESIEDCYLALDLVHDLWPPIEGHVNDYIAAPKKNGYRSLHTTVRCLDDRLVEIQMRTRQMHVVAEYGMHWIYKNFGAVASLSLEESTELAETVLRHQERIRQAYQGQPDAAAEGQEVLEHDHLHIYTRDGLLKMLPRGATPLDFAYSVHTEVGNHTVGAQVIVAGGEKRPVALDVALQDGETLEVLCRDDSHPTYDWLARAQTKKARTEIMRYLRTHRRDRDLERLGRERIEAELRGLGLGASLEDMSGDDLTWLIRQLQQASPAALLVALGSDKIDVSSVRALLRARLKLRTPSTTEHRGGQPEIHLAPLTGLHGILTRWANCCHPLPGDELTGYVSRGSGIVIHRVDCSNLPNLRSRFPERIVAVEWPRGEQAQGLRVHVIVEGSDRVALLREVTSILDRHDVPVVKLDPLVRADSQRIVVQMVLEIRQLDQLHGVLRDLRTSPVVLFADRSLPHGRLVGVTRRSEKLSTRPPR